MTKKKKIRPLALCIFRRGDKIFVSDGYDALKDQAFYRAIGGGIDFGEAGHETVRREVRNRGGSQRFSISRHTREYLHLRR